MTADLLYNTASNEVAVEVVPYSTASVMPRLSIR